MRVSTLILGGLLAAALTVPAHAGGGGGGGGGESGSGSSARNRIQAGFSFNEDGTINTGSGGDGHGSGHDAPTDDGHGEAGDGHGASSGGHGDEVAEDNPRLVTLPTLVVPLSRDNRLTGYGFVTVRFLVASGFDHWDIREHAHFALDGLIRASHRTPVSSDDGQSIDPARAEAAWRAALSEQFGEGVVDTLLFEVPDIRRIGR